MKYDEVYDYVGQIGFFQVCTCACLLLLCLLVHDAISMIFVGADMPHWCQVPQLANFSYNRQKYIAIPMQDDEYSACEMYDLNYDNYSTEDYLNWNRTLMAVNDTQLVPCSQWIYEQTVFISTIVSRVSALAIAIVYSRCPGASIPPETMMHFPSLFQIFPQFQKNFRTFWKF